MLLQSLSPREREILLRIAAGEPQKAIAVELEISPSAVKEYIRRAKRKLSARSVIQLATIYAVEVAAYRVGEVET